MARGRATSPTPKSTITSPARSAVCCATTSRSPAPEARSRSSRTPAPAPSAGFQRTLPAATPQIAGREATLKEAIAAAAERIKAAKLPLYGGMATDVDGCRAVVSLADKSCGVIDHALSEGQYRNIKTVQTSGWIMSTLTETRNRADLIIIVGSDVHKLHDRFFERIVCVPHRCSRRRRRSARWCSSATTSTPPAPSARTSRRSSSSSAPTRASTRCWAPCRRASTATRSEDAGAAGAQAQRHPLRAVVARHARAPAAGDRRRQAGGSSISRREVQEGRLRRHGVGAAGAELPAGRPRRAAHLRRS